MKTLKILVEQTNPILTNTIIDIIELYDVAYNLSYSDDMYTLRIFKNNIHPIINDIILMIKCYILID